MSDLLFIQDSRVGRTTFHLQRDLLEASRTHRGERQRAQIPLKILSGNYDRYARRLPILFIIPLLLCVPCLGLIGAILSQKVVPHEFIIYPGFFLLGLLPAAIRGIPRIDFFQFYNHWKRPVFFIVRERSQAEECDAFVRELLDRIERVENDLPIAEEERNEAPVSAIALPAPKDFDLFRSGEHRWKASIVLGALSAGLPWLNQLGYLLDLFQFPLIFALAVGGMVTCVLSFMAKERFRYASLIGAMLSLVAPLFY